MPFAVSALLAFAGCGDSGGSADAGLDAAPPGWTAVAALPAPVGNNATAALALEGGCMLFSGLGLGPGLLAADITTAAYRWRPGQDDRWLPLPDVPGEPRLAASAVALRGDFYVLGGYTVSGTGAEASSDLLLRFNQRSGKWDTLAPLPVAIDDAVAVTWRDRYIVVVSGWSDTANVSAAQLYDVESDTWSQATAFPGVAVFGHAGALSGDALLIVDGAASSAGFPLQSQVWRGDLHADDPTRIDWTDLGTHPGPPRYRAAAGTAADGRVIIHGGTATPYNFDGLRYDNGEAAEPLATSWSYDPETGAMTELAHDKPTATMDHRSLPSCEGRLYSVGGIVRGPETTADSWALAL